MTSCTKKSLTCTDRKKSVKSPLLRWQLTQNQTHQANLQTWKRRTEFGSKAENLNQAVQRNLWEAEQRRQPLPAEGDGNSEAVICEQLAQKFWSLSAVSQQEGARLYQANQMIKYLFSPVNLIYCIIYLEVNGGVWSTVHWDRRGRQSCFIRDLRQALLTQHQRR